MLKNKISRELDQAIERLRDGGKIDEVLLGVPEKNRAQISELLNISESIRSLPQKAIPSPSHRRMFLQHTAEKVSHISFFVRTMKTSYAISAAVAILIVAGTVTAANRSLPGDPLFGLKKTLEIAQIKIEGRNPALIAQLELSLANQRLNDAQQVFSDNSSDSAAKAQAVQELDSQTQLALNQIQQVASSQAVAGDPSIIQNLENLTKSQASLQSKVNPVAAQNTNQQNQQTIKNIKSLVAVANDKSGVNIPSQKSTTYSDVITNISDKTITVGKNVFQINDKTQFLNADGTSLKQSDLQEQDSVTVTGTTSGDLNIAQTVTLDKKYVAPPAPAASTSSTATAQASVDGSQSIPETVQQSQNDITGGYILESPQQ